VQKIDTKSSKPQCFRRKNNPECAEHSVLSRMVPHRFGPMSNRLEQDACGLARFLRNRRASRAALVGLNVILANGGKMITLDGKLVLRIPVQEPVAPVKLEQIQWKDDKPILDAQP
jgi:hypothetical protein